MSLKMKFLQGKVNDQVSYPVTTDEGVELSSGETLKEFITKITKNFNWMGNNTVTKNHLQKESVTDEKISKYKSSVAGSGIQTASIADGAITDAKILPYKLKSGSSTEYVGGLSGDKIKNGAITNEKISGGISGSKIEDGTITLEKAAFGQIDFICLIDSTAVTSVSIAGYRALVLGIAAQNNPWELLNTNFIPLIENDNYSFKDKKYTCHYPDIKENGTGSATSYFVQLTINAQGEGSLKLHNSTYANAILFGIK